MYWVIVVMPGGDIYDMYSEKPSGHVAPSLRRRLLKGGLKTMFAAAQLWYWIRS